jgi:hypothetical protein
LYQKKTGKDQASFVKNPLFINAAKGDYRLTANSPCVNAGIQTSASVDFEGKKIRGTIDIGAYEFAPNEFSKKPVKKIRTISNVNSFRP